MTVLLGGPVWPEEESGEAWAMSVLDAGYRAAPCPITPAADSATRRAYARAAQKAGIVIAEVGAWSNPLSDEASQRRAAIQKCAAALNLAEEIGAVCCVNIAGSRGSKWDGPHPANFTDETFEMIVATVQQIIDTVQPTRTCYTLEMMPWALPDSPHSYLDLIKAIDRTAFGVHFDPVNIINSPRRYFDNGRLIRECVRLLGPHLKGCHAKDIKLRSQLTVHLDEVLPGEGFLDYPTFLRALNGLPRDIPLLLEHLPDQESYQRAAANLRAIAQASGFPL